MADMVLFTVTNIAFNPLYPTVFYIGTCPGAGPRVQKQETNTIHGPAKGFKHVKGSSLALQRVQCFCHFSADIPLPQLCIESTWSSGFPSSCS